MRPANGQSKGLLLFFPSAKIDKYNVGSETLMTFEGVLSFFGYTVIIPDLLGYGVSKQVEYPFMFSDNTARVAYDMHLSAAEYFSTTGLPFPREVTLGGYSMAGMGVVSLHRYIEQNHPGNIIIRESITGGGIYDLGLAVDLFSEIKYCESPFVPFIFKSLDYWYDLNLNYSEVFIEPLLSHMTNAERDTQQSGDADLHTTRYDYLYASRFFYKGKKCLIKENRLLPAPAQCSKRLGATITAHLNSFKG
jgi:hypothetical protein